MNLPTGMMATMDDDTTCIVLVISEWLREQPKYHEMVEAALSTISEYVGNFVEAYRLYTKPTYIKPTRTRNAPRPRPPKVVIPKCQCPYEWTQSLSEWLDSVENAEMVDAGVQTDPPVEEEILAVGEVVAAEEEIIAEEEDEIAEEEYEYEFAAEDVYHQPSMPWYPPQSYYPALYHKMYVAGYDMSAQAILSFEGQWLHLPYMSEGMWLEEHGCYMVTYLAPYMTWSMNFA
jgi:hypothetical protein